MLRKTPPIVAVLAGMLAATALHAPAHAAIDDLTLISGAFGGLPLVPNQVSDSPKVSGDGRYVAFSSEAANLVTGDASGMRDIFRRDTWTGETVLVSRADGHAGAPGDSDSAGEDGLAISADGRFVAFASEADNLSADDHDDVSNVYVRDVAGGRTYLASRNDAGAAAVGGDSGFGVDISGDGRYVVFETEATNMPGTALGEQVVRRDIVADSTVLVSSTVGGTAGNGHSGYPRVSDDGTRVAFPTAAINLGAGGNDPPDGQSRIVVRDLAANTLVIASRLDGADGAPQVSYEARISADGGKAGWSHGDRFYVRDLTAGTTVDVSAGPNGGPILGCCDGFELSGDGRYVASYAGGTTPDDYLVHHRDTAAGITRVVSRPAGPDTAPAFSRSEYGVAISDSGRYVAFGSTSVLLSDADYRGPTPGQNDSDVFLRDVLGPPPPPPPVPVDPPDQKAPAVTAVSVAPKRFRVAKGPTAIVAAKRQGAKRRSKGWPAPRGTQIRFTLSEPATARIAISRKLPGLRSKRRGRTVCVAPTERDRAAARESIAKRPAIARLKGAAKRRAIARAEGKLRCTRYQASGVLTRRGLAVGKRSVPFSGRIGAKALKPGAYRVQVGATDAAGNRSAKRAEANFQVVR